MVEKQKKFSKTRCCIRIINLTASICFVITPILRIMYKGFPAFETIDDNLNVFDFLSHPLPLESPKNIRRQVYMVVKQVPTFQKAILHKIITSKVTLMCGRTRASAGAQRAYQGAGKAAGVDLARGCLGEGERTRARG